MSTTPAVFRAAIAAADAGNAGSWSPRAVGLVQGLAPRIKRSGRPQHILLATSLDVIQFKRRNAVEAWWAHDMLKLRLLEKCFFFLNRSSRRFTYEK